MPLVGFTRNSLFDILPFSFLLFFCFFFFLISFCSNTMSYLFAQKSLKRHNLSLATTTYLWLLLFGPPHSPPPIAAYSKCPLIDTSKDQISHPPQSNPIHPYTPTSLHPSCVILHTAALWSLSPLPSRSFASRFLVSFFFPSVVHPSIHSFFLHCIA
jgi:hypothetical protein